MYSLLFFGCWHHIGPVVPYLFTLPSSVSSSPSFLSAFFLPCAFVTAFFFHLIFLLSLLLSVLTLSLKKAHVSQCPKQPSLTPLVFFMFCPSVYPSHAQSTINPPSASPPLISLPMLWLVSPISVRNVITAVSFLGENKVILCSWHHKR